MQPQVRSSYLWQEVAYLTLQNVDGCQPPRIEFKSVLLLLLLLEIHNLSLNNRFLLLAVVEWTIGWRIGSPALVEARRSFWFECTIH